MLCMPSKGDKVDAVLAVEEGNPIIINYLAVAIRRSASVIKVRWETHLKKETRFQFNFQLYTTIKSFHQ